MDLSACLRLGAAPLSDKRNSLMACGVVPTRLAASSRVSENEVENPTSFLLLYIVLSRGDWQSYRRPPPFWGRRQMEPDDVPRNDVGYGIGRINSLDQAD
jgi:hypothetical protein